jgi:hypothetical protein
MEFDNHGLAQELKLYTENDGDIYRQQIQPILKNLATKAARGIYKHEGGAKLFMYLTETGAKKYAREFGGPGATWHEMFPIAIRRVVADEWASEFEVEYKNGSYESMLPKKYQAANVEKSQKGQAARLATMGWYVGQRASMHPATDAFMMGDRYGDVVKVEKTKIHVKMDRSGKTRLVSPGNLEHVE